MPPQPDPEPAPWRVLVVETPVPGVLLGHVQLLLPEPADPIIGLTTTEDGEW